MSPRLHSWFALFLAAAAAAPLAAQDAEFRRPVARPNATLFSPLDLPRPDRLRNGAGAPGPDYWQQKVDYKIQASLDPATRLVAGKAHVSYLNASPDALPYLWLNLEQNAFRQDSIAAGVGGRTAIGMRHAEGGGYGIREVSARGKRLDFQVYDTLGRIDLPKPVAPNGGVFEFDIEWDFVIPETVFRRFGIEKVAQGTSFEVAQWFPAVAVYDDVHGWNTLPYIGTGEFYSNFGDYEVELTAPPEFVVVCTGELQNPKEVFTNEQAARLRKARKSKKTVMIIAPEEVGGPNSRPNGKSLTWKFKAEMVRTVAWAASDAFILDAAGLDGVLIQSAYPKEALEFWKDSTQMLRTAIDGYNRRWFKYPYPVATNVSGAEGGMEYPMIIFCRGRRSEEGLYGVTAHEIGHNWFPMVVNTDERRHAWMDEGFNTFINYYSAADWFDDPQSGRAHPASFAGAMRGARQLPIETPADHFSGGLLGQTEYAKTGVGLVMLRESILGPERFDFAFRTYIDRWAFKSPRPADFFRCMEDAAGVDLAWFWRGWFLETGTIDLEVTGVDQPEEDQPAKITFRSLGELVMPLRFRVGFEDGTTQDYDLPVEIWFASDRIVEKIPGDRRIASVLVDWKEEFPDLNRDNNEWLAEEEGSDID
ncbi:MAG: M1 family metallopeptidase [Planctomycetes bacterium]|nr:M1 family metallopeptidase [Planctomycetota bacterium]